MPHNGLHMLPNLKILICGVVFTLLLFAVTGAGVLLPESYTRVGEMPEVGRPMMQRMIADEPAQAQFHVLMVARRSEELDRLRERAALEVVPAQPVPDLLKPAVIENAASDDVLATVAATPALQPSGAMGTVPASAAGSIQVRPAAAKPDEASDAALPIADTDPVKVAALTAAITDTEPSDSWPSLLKVPLPPLRPSARTSGVHRRAIPRKHRVAAPAPSSDTFGQNLFGQPPSPPR